MCLLVRSWLFFFWRVTRERDGRGFGRGKGNSRHSYRCWPQQGPLLVIAVPSLTAQSNEKLDGECCPFNGPFNVDGCLGRLVGWRARDVEKAGVKTLVDAPISFSMAARGAQVRVIFRKSSSSSRIKALRASSRGLLWHEDPGPIATTHAIPTYFPLSLKIRRAIGFRIDRGTCCGCSMIANQEHMCQRVNSTPITTGYPPVNFRPKTVDAAVQPQGIKSEGK
jgi:hypothetical protein